jgi:F5/8 type C domain
MRRRQKKAGASRAHISRLFDMQKLSCALGWLRHARWRIAVPFALLSMLCAGSLFAQTLVEIRPITAGNASGALSSPQYMVDGNPNTAWNAGGPPIQWIDIDLQRDRQVLQIQLLTSQSPAGPTQHNVYGRTQAGQWLVVGTLAGYTRDNQWLTLDVPPSIPFRYLIIQTTGGPSWVAWREIKAFEGLKPRARGDIVGRELDSSGIRSLGHLGFWDGERVFEVLNESTVVQRNSYENFASRSRTWDPISTKIPYFSVSSCFAASCYWNSNSIDRNTFDSRRAIAARPEQIRMIGASYTVALPSARFAMPAMSQPGNPSASRPAVRGTYRCDVYMLDIFGFTSTPWGSYGSMWFTGTSFPVERVVNGDPPSWTTNIRSLHNGTLLPSSIYDRFKAFIQ